MLYFVTYVRSSDYFTRIGSTQNTDNNALRAYVQVIQVTLYDHMSVNLELTLFFIYLWCLSTIT